MVKNMDAMSVIIKAARNDALKRHSEALHEGIKKLKTFVCTVCAKAFLSKHELKYHIESKHENIRYNCDKCDKGFRRQRSCKEHIQRCKIRNKLPPQSISEKLPKSNLAKPIDPPQSTLENQSQARLPELIDLICNHCEKNYGTKEELEMHIKSMNEGKLFSCSQCNYSSFYRCNIYFHIDSQHFYELTNHLSAFLVFFSFSFSYDLT